MDCENIGNDDSGVKVFQQRYEKALKVVKKLKKKYFFETEVCKELARRNDYLMKKDSQSQENTQFLQQNLNQLMSIVIKGNLAEAMSFATTLQTKLSGNANVARITNLVSSKRRSSSVCIKLPEQLGTSLIRKSSESISDGSNTDQSNRALALGDDRAAEASNLVDDYENFGTEVNGAIDQFPFSPIFEHFIVVGAPPEAATELALKLRHQEDAKLSTRLMRRIGDYMMGGSGGATSNSTRSTGNDFLDVHVADSSNPDPKSSQQHFVTGSTGISMGVPSLSLPTSSSFFNAASNESTANVGPTESSASNNAFALLRGKTSSMFSRLAFNSTPSTPFTAAEGRTSRSNSTAGTTKSNEVASDEAHVSDSSTVCSAVDGDQMAVAGIAAVAPSPPAVIPASTLSSTDSNGGTAVTDATMLFRYPQSAEPPPAEVCDFCMPLGGRLQHITQRREDSVVQEILYGHGCSKRSSRCFIFMLEDKSIASGSSGSGSAGSAGEELQGQERLYGICVVHPRLLSAVINANSSNAVSNTGQQPAVKLSYDFESPVCYAFLTRFPLFDFFFQILFDMITAERLHRMEMLASYSPGETGAHLDRREYAYLPRMLLEDMLERLTRVPPPRYGEKLIFHTSLSLSPVICQRPRPSSEDVTEHAVASSEWALPTLLSWMPIEVLVWAIGLLMCEVKLVVVGTEAGMVSCGLMGLLSLLRPLEWVAPLIPVLPSKHIDFVESPVPIIAGLVLDSTAVRGESAMWLLKKFNDVDNGTISGVLDVSERELFLSGAHAEVLKELLLPGAEALIDRLKDCLAGTHATVTDLHLGDGGSGPDLGAHAGARRRPLYSVSPLQRAEAKSVQEQMERHVRTVAEAARASRERLRKEKALAIAQRLSCPAGSDSTSVVSLREQDTSSHLADFSLGLGLGLAAELDDEVGELGRLATDDDADEEEELILAAIVNCGVDTEELPRLESGAAAAASAATSAAPYDSMGLHVDSPTVASGQNEGTAVKRVDSPDWLHIGSQDSQQPASIGALGGGKSRLPLRSPFEGAGDWLVRGRRDESGQPSSALSSSTAKTIRSTGKEDDRVLDDSAEEDGSESDSDEEANLRMLDEYYASFLRDPVPEGVEANTTPSDEGKSERVALSGGVKSMGSRQAAAASAASQYLLTVPSSASYFTSAAKLSPSLSGSAGNSTGHAVGSFFGAFLSSSAGSNPGASDGAGGMQSFYGGALQGTTDGFLALTKQSLEGDMDAFIRRFAATQMYAEYFEVGDEDLDPTSFDDDEDEDSGRLLDLGLGPRISSGGVRESVDECGLSSPLPLSGSVETLPSTNPSLAGEGDRRTRGRSLDVDASSSLSSFASTASRVLNITPLAQSVAITSASGLGIAIGANAVRGAQKQMRKSLSSRRQTASFFSSSFSTASNLGSSTLLDLHESLISTGSSGSNLFDQAIAVETQSVSSTTDVDIVEETKSIDSGGASVVN